MSELPLQYTSALPWLTAANTILDFGLESTTRYCSSAQTPIDHYLAAVHRQSLNFESWDVEVSLNHALPFPALDRLPTRLMPIECNRGLGFPARLLKAFGNGAKFTGLSGLLSNFIQVCEALWRTI